MPQAVCRPSGTRLYSTFLPGTYVPGFPMSPLRGWSSGVFHSLAVLWVCDTDSFLAVLGVCNTDGHLARPAGRGRPALH